MVTTKLGWKVGRYKINFFVVNSAIKGLEQFWSHKEGPGQKHLKSEIRKAWKGQK